MAWVPVDQSLRNHRKLLVLASELGVSQAAAAGHLVFFWLWCLDNAPDGIIKQYATADKRTSNTQVAGTDRASKCNSDTKVGGTDAAKKCKSNSRVISTNSAGKPKGNTRVIATDGATKCIGSIRLIATACAWRRNPDKLVSALLSAGFLEKHGRGGRLRIHDWSEYGGKLLRARDLHREVVRRSRDGLEKSRSDQSREEESRSTPLKPPQGGARRRRRNQDDRSPLSGKHREKVNH